MKLPIYLDYAATTPVDTRVANKMMHYLTQEGCFANPASISHILGQQAKHAIDGARQQVADLIHAEPAEIIWTSGATEANNLALKGTVELYRRKGKHIVTMKTEHKSVLDSCQQLEKAGYEVTYLSPQPSGKLDLDVFQAALRDDTILVSIMHVNNETGVIQDIHSIAAITANRGILFHVDAAQSLGKIAIDVTQTPVDLLACSAHKIYGPKGIGALYIKRKPRVRVAAQIHGGGHEQGMRSGTLATHQIIGMGEACEIAMREMQKDFQHVAKLRELFYQQLLIAKEINNDFINCYPGIINLRFPKRADALMQALPEIAMAAGSACLAKGIEPSYVLRAQGLSAEEAYRSLRISIGRFTTAEEINFAASFFNRLG